MIDPPGLPAHEDLRLIPIGQITGSFLVPAYQRGYRWGGAEVSQLLEDIHRHRDGIYCLQPIVVQRHTRGTETSFELVDGQQRLTTLYLLYRYLHSTGLYPAEPSFSLTYETRERSAEFLRSLDSARRRENIDFAHLSDAYARIASWFDARGARREAEAATIVDRLATSVQVIWYQVSEAEPATALFTRLNVGRIPLTSAELIRALLLRGAPALGCPVGEDRRRQLEIATAWDWVERDLHRVEFWAFLTNDPAAHPPTHIALLFDLLALPHGQEPRQDEFHTFFHFRERLEEGDTGDWARRAEALWGEVTDLHELLREWYEDRELFHKIGYLIATSDQGHSALGDLIRDAQKSTRSAFRQSLDERIRQRLKLSRADLLEIGYDRHRKKCEQALLLFNVESTLRLRHSHERYSFHAHKAQSWSLEHIHAQHAESLNRHAQWETWLREHRESLLTLRPSDQDQAKTCNNLIARIDAALPALTREAFTPLSTAISAFFSDVGAGDGSEVHGLDNLALLPRETNSALNNAVFDVKRRRLLACERTGAYLPLCTRRVFLKYYTVDAPHLHFWSQEDRSAYRAAMFEADDGALTNYLLPSTVTS